LIINLLGTEHPETEIFRNLKSKIVDQKFIYFESGAAGYYANEFYNPAPEAFIDFVRNILTGKKEGEVSSKAQAPKTAFISLGCGNNLEESRILNKLPVDITLFGVDSSAAMLELSKEILAPCDFKYFLLQADFTGKQFKEKLDNLLGDFTRRVFFISGFTFGNFDSRFVLLIKSLLKPGDLFIFYVITVVDLHLYREIFVKDSRDALKNTGKMAAYFEPLKKLKIPRNNGKMIMEVSDEKEIGALCFRYSFQFSRYTKIRFKNERVKFLPGEKILLQTIRIYDYYPLTGFFKTAGFKFLDLEVQDNINVIYAYQKI
jgi:hypothetical protein